MAELYEGTRIGTQAAADDLDGHPGEVGVELVHDVGDIRHMDVYRVGALDEHKAGYGGGGSGRWPRR
jgi:hypothetical protein